jgi:muramoyltetrapeptide carboxypeptidase
VRMIDALDFTGFKQNPKWIIGFSDITVFHNHLHNELGIASIHSKMCNSFPDDWSKAEPVQIETIESIKKAIQGEPMQYKVPADEKNRQGTAEGLLVGGNLKILETLAGTVSDISTKNKILFVEDTGEALYNIDRMFCHLQRTGKLEQLAGLLVGGFVGIKAEAPEDTFGRTVYDIVWEKVKQYNYPVCFGFPVGHQRNNFALKCGVKHRLTVDANGSSLEEKR